MAKLIAVLLAALAVAFPSVAQEGKILRLDMRYSDLPVEYRKPVELTFAYDRWVSPNSFRTIEGLFSVGLIDLNDDGVFEVAIQVEHVIYGIVPRAGVLIARKTDEGWRYFGHIGAPQFSRHKSLPPRLADKTQIYVEDKTVGGWRVINNGSAWVNKHLSCETDNMGGDRFFWAKIAPLPSYLYAADVRWSLPFDSGGPGYFNIVETAEPCPKS